MELNESHSLRSGRRVRDSKVICQGTQLVLRPFGCTPHLQDLMYRQTENVWVSLHFSHSEA